MKKACIITIEGKVQGVGFRYFVLNKANKNNITGYVRNEINGDVYIFAEGLKDNLYSFIVTCYKGPVLSKITKVHVNNTALRNLNEFKIER